MASFARRAWPPAWPSCAATDAPGSIARSPRTRGRRDVQRVQASVSMMRRRSSRCRCRRTAPGSCRAQPVAEAIVAVAPRGCPADGDALVVGGMRGSVVRTRNSKSRSTAITSRDGAGRSRHRGRVCRSDAASSEEDARPAPAMPWCGRVLGSQAAAPQHGVPHIVIASAVARTVQSTLRHAHPRP